MFFALFIHVNSTAYVTVFWKGYRISVCSFFLHQVALVNVMLSM